MSDIPLLINLFVSLIKLKNINKKHQIEEHINLYPLTYFFPLIGLEISNNRSSHPEVFLRKGFLKTCSKFTGGNPYRRAKQLY